MKKNKYDTFLVLKKVKKNKLLHNLSTLNIEKNKVQLVRETLNEMIDSTDLNKVGESYGLDLKVNANFRQSLMNKLEISSNRAAHLQNEINYNLSEIGKIDKQKQKIREKKKLTDLKKEKLLDMKKDNYIRPKNQVPF
ncbi:MAG: hypothetical protein CBC25_08675 [Pelagibacteraceae bacterium TMED65]|nr:hypothetical protein [Rickettsiales bacterium]OUU50186.1 MAG: hypothetical protein CBC25_08675 [Pelagibacteraceae bacterium TMED65]|tara:strand:+ start:2693 stop:3106 length:414 start_codon:yes stop_codon:yes gene_type:complete